jgi:hypothetical protein
MKFRWNHSETIAVAKESCSQCRGSGLRRNSRGKGSEAPCNCVLRTIFRSCYARFRLCLEQEKHISHVCFEIVGGQDRRPVWGRKDEEYIADFCLVSKRYLDEFEYKVFRFHFLLGADWRLCCRQLKMEKGIFFHAVYRIQQKLGRAFRELTPYPLFPLDEYFGAVIRRELSIEARNILHMPSKSEKRRGLRPPLRKVA